MRFRRPECHNRDPESKTEKAPVKALGDPSYRPTTQNVGAFAPVGAADDLEMIEKLARGYIYTDKSKAEICAHNAEVSVPLAPILLRVYMLICLRGLGCR